MGGGVPQARRGMEGRGQERKQGRGGVATQSRTRVRQCRGGGRMQKRTGEHGREGGEEEKKRGGRQ